MIDTQVGRVQVQHQLVTQWCHLSEKLSGKDYSMFDPSSQTDNIFPFMLLIIAFLGLGRLFARILQTYREQKSTELSLILQNFYHAQCRNLISWLPCMTECNDFVQTLLTCYHTWTRVLLSVHSWHTWDLTESSDSSRCRCVTGTRMYWNMQEENK